jgi:hypothetical protein
MGLLQALSFRPSVAGFVGVVGQLLIFGGFSVRIVDGARPGGGRVSVARSWPVAEIARSMVRPWRVIDPPRLCENALCDNGI